MNRSIRQDIALFGTLEEQEQQDGTLPRFQFCSPEIVRLVEQDLMHSADIQFRDRPSTCSRCGKFVPRSASMGWRKDNIQVIDLEKIQDDPDECEVCRMIITGLKSYQDHVGRHIPLPAFISIKCTPGRSLIVKKGIGTTTISRDGNQNDMISQPQEQQTPDDIIGTQGLEFFVKPGNIRRNGIYTSLIANYKTSQTPQAH